MKQPACKGKTLTMYPPVWKRSARNWINHELVEQARRLCAACPVSEGCLDTAIRYGEADGVWGGVWMSSHDDVKRRLSPTQYKEWDKNHRVLVGKRSALNNDETKNLSHRRAMMEREKRIK